MNKELMLKIADFIEKNPEKFDHDKFGTSEIYSNVIRVYEMQGDNTPCCLAGLACVLSKQEGKELDNSQYIDNEAAKLLDIDFSEMHVLFNTHFWEINAIDWKTQPEKVVEHLREIANGEIAIIK